MRGSAAFRAAVAPGGVLAGPWVRNELWRGARAVPSLDLRFAENKSLVDATTGADLVTFTRASSGTFVGSDGLIKTATTNEARFDHNPTTGESLGLLVEEQRTNIALQSNGFDTSWTNTESVETANQATAPDGTNSGWKLVNTAVSQGHNIFQSVAWTAVTTTVSVFVKYLDHRWVGIRMGAAGNQFFGSWDLQNSVVGSVTAGATIGMQAFGNGWYRLTLTATLTSAGGANLIIGLNNADAVALTTYTGTGTGIYIFGAQVEVGAFPTSYIPTTSATVTRSADVASITGTNFSSWYRQDEGTLYAEGSVPVGVSGARALASISNGTNNERIIIGHNGTTAANGLVVDGNTSQTSFTVTANSFPPGERKKVALAYKVDDFGFTTVPGTTVEQDSSGTLPTVDRLQIGNAPGRTEPNQPIRRLTYWPQRLPNTTLQQITQ
jgi:hypothetical protein